MPLYQVIILAIVQGFTEFLPVSSTAHLFLTSWLLGWKPETLEFDIALHVGTLAAVLVYFFQDWVQIAAQGLGMDYGRDLQLRQNRALLWLIAIGTPPGWSGRPRFRRACRNHLAQPGRDGRHAHRRRRGDVGGRPPPDEETRPGIGGRWPTRAS